MKIGVEKVSAIVREIRFCDGEVCGSAARLRSAARVETD
jgi:hypothetical protein